MLPPALPQFLVRLLSPAERLLGLILPQIGGVWVVDIVKQVPAPFAPSGDKIWGWVCRCARPFRAVFCHGKNWAARLAREFENHQFGHKVLPC